MHKIIANGARLSVAQTMPEDIDDDYLAMYTNDGGKNAFFRQSGREFNKDELVKFCVEGIEQRNCFYYSVFLSPTDRPIGSIRIGVIDRKNSLSDMVVLIGSTEGRGKGLGTEAIALGNRIAFDIHQIRKLHGGVLDPNRGSLIAYQRAGWVAEGYLPNHYIIDGKPTGWTPISCYNPFYLWDGGIMSAELVSDRWDRR